MKEKKKSSNWYIAATHYITAGFVPFLLGGIAFSFIAVSLISSGITNEYLFAFLQALFFLIIIYLGVRYSANYLNKAYIIKDKNRVVNLATTYYIFLNVIGLGILDRDLTIVIINIVLAALFYTFSKKYIKNSELTYQNPE
jgi:hypothetical protein